MKLETPFSLTNPITGSRIGMISNFGKSKRSYSVYSMPKIKVCMPQLGNRLSRDLWIAYLDFDRLPSDFETWEGLEAYLNLFPQLCVFKSVSGKPKGMMLLSGRSWNKLNVLGTLSKILGQDIVKYIDQQGLNHSFVVPSQENQTIIQGYLDSAVPTEMVCDYEGHWTEHGEAYQYKDLNKSQNRLLHAIHCSLGAMDVPVEFWGRQFGISGSMVSRYLRDMVGKGILSLEDKNYSVGIKAKRYFSLRYSPASHAVHMMGQGGFRYLLNQSSIKESSRVIPYSIPDGEWFKTLWSATNAFDNESDYLGWVLGLEGVNRPGKGRLAKARSAWKSHDKRGLYV
jgi:hypothetical protein